MFLTSPLYGDIRRYGLYRTIGMSRKQVRRLINRQALWLACIGIPWGCSWASSWAGRRFLR